VGVDVTGALSGPAPPTGPELISGQIHDEQPFPTTGRLLERLVLVTGSA
jgi:hypothetical protein